MCGNVKEIPIVFIKNGKVFGEKKKAFHVLKEMHKKYGDVYAIDIDGFKRNRANIDTYKKFSLKPFLWIDAFPRCPGDVMDLIISGAKIVVLRPLMNDDDLREIRNMCEMELFLADKDKKIVKKAKNFGFDGVVLFNIKGDVKNGIQIWGAYPKERKVIRLG